MKHLLILSAIVILAFSCKQEAPKDYAIISGKITNPIPNAIFTINKMDRSHSDTLALAEDGTFKDTLRIDTDHYMFYDGKNFAPIYIDKGNSINITYDANDFNNTLGFSGEGADVSNYLLKKKTIEKDLLGPDNVYTLDEAEYKTAFSKVKDSLTAYITSAQNIPAAYIDKEKRNLTYDYLSKLNIYKLYHAYYTKKTDFDVSEGFLSELNNIDYGNEVDFNFSNSYVGLVNSHYQKQAEAIAKSDSIAPDLAYIQAVSKVQSNVIKNTLLFNNAKSGITYTNDLEAFYSAYMEASTNEEHKAEITKSYNKLKTLAKGNPSPKFVDYMNYEGGTTSLDDLKGKFVYIDVWATWCGPCKREIPFLKEVEEQYHDKNIAFVSLSIDKADDKDKWRSMIEDKDMGGIQLFADKDWASSFVKDYQIQGIPRFILIDTEGNIISANAPRPSDSKLIDLFNEYEI